jgi:hypothetical protein
MVHESKESHYKQVELRSSGWVFISCFTDCHYKVVSSNPANGEVYSIQHYVIKFVSDLRQIGGFLRFPPPIKLTATI